MYGAMLPTNDHVGPPYYVYGPFWVEDNAIEYAKTLSTDPDEGIVVLICPPREEN